jgi:Putative prokaryotic signal transducing protein
MSTHNEDEIVVLKVFNDLLTAGFAQNKLKEEGIEAFLADENVVGLNPLGGIELKIFLKDMERAKEILAR